MKTVCVDARMINFSGIGTYIRNLLPRLIRKTPYKYRLLLPVDCTQPLDMFPNCDLITCSSAIYSLKEQVEIPIRAKNCDLFWTPHYNVPILPIKAKKRLVTIHDVFHLRHIKTLPLHKQLYAKFVMKKATVASDAIITVSDFSKSEIVSLTNTDPNKIQKIYLGIDHDWFSKFNYITLDREVREMFSPPSDFILYVGNVKPHKNIQGAIAAFKKWIIEKKLDHYFVIIGKHFSDFLLKKTVQNDEVLRDRVVFFDAVGHSHLRWFYSNAIATVIPSFYEGFGIPAIEAMCMGSPVLASKAASLPEVCGDACIYVDPASADSIYDGLQNIIFNQPLRTLIKEKGLENVTRFNWDVASQQHADVFERLMQN
jgi:glycosyltransferase involved in cell wall biosynthesis